MTKDTERVNYNNKDVSDTILRHHQQSSKRNIPKPVPDLPKNLSYSAYLKYQEIDLSRKPSKVKRTPITRDRPRSKVSRSVTPKEGNERYKDDNIVVISDNVVKNKDISNNLNPFHNEFNKVIENPFHKSEDMSLSTELTDDNTTITDDAIEYMWNGKETVNTAIVDIYDQKEGCDPFLKMRVIMNVTS